MKILSLDTTEQACSAALLLDDELVERFEVAPRQHSRLLLPMVESLLAGAGLALAQLDALAFARGPGSFTGVRIATAVAQGLALAVDLPVVPVSSLLALAQGAARARGARQILALLDARMQEVYALAGVRGEDGLMQAQGAETVGPPAAVSLPGGGDWVLAGSGVATYGEVLAHLGSTQLPECQVHAADVARLAVALVRRGEMVAAEAALPMYLRDQVAQKMTPLN